MAEQSGYFVASEWAQGGCAALYQQPEEGKCVNTAQRFPLVCLSSSPSGRQQTDLLPFAWPQGTWCNLILEQVAPSAYMARGSASAETFPAQGFALYSDCVSVQD